LRQIRSAKPRLEFNLASVTGAVWIVSQDWNITDDQWAIIDEAILACDGQKARRRVREEIGLDAEDARKLVRQRCELLRRRRPADFAWSVYPCEDYLASDFASQGYWDESAQLMFIVPAPEAEVREDIAFLMIGRPGWDGIELGYRKGCAGLWAYYPTDCEFVFMAPTIASLVARWSSGELSF
jgi:hypothetical protein